MCLAIPGVVTDLFDDSGVPMANVDFGGVSKEICVVYLPSTRPGEHVLVHAGFAIAAVGDDEADETMELLGDLEAGPP